MSELITFVTKHWHDPRFRLAAPIIATAATAFSLATLTNPPTRSWHAAISLTAGTVTFLYWRFAHRWPQTKKGKIGFALAVFAEDAAHELQIRNDLTRVVRTLVLSDSAETRLQLIEVPDYLASQCVDEDFAISALLRMRAHIMFYGLIKKRSLQGQPSHMINLEGVVRHGSPNLETQKALSSDFVAVTPRKVQFTIDNDALSFELTSEWVDIAARYMLGLAAFASGDAVYSEKMLVSAERLFHERSNRLRHLRWFGARVNDKLLSLYSQWSVYLYHEFFLRRDRTTVEQLEPVVTKLLLRNPNDLGAHALAAMCQFFLHRNIAKAKEHLNQCKKGRDVAWRFSMGFLLAYEGRVDEALNRYREAFRGTSRDPTLGVQVEEFIQIVLDLEPTKGQLHFFSAQINQFLKLDPTAARRDYETFLRHECSTTFPRIREEATKELQMLTEEPGT